MPLAEIFNRQSRRSLLLEVNPYQILAAGLSRPDKDGAVQLECAAEFDRDDDDGLRAWLDANFDKQKGWVPVISSFVPPDHLLQRESILPKKLAEPDYLPNLVREQYKIEKPEDWRLLTLSPLEGVPLPAEGTQRPALVCGVSHHDVHQLQQRLLDHRLLPYRLELGVLPLLGAISDYKARHNDKRAIVVVTIEQEHTVAYILGKEGVHTPAPVRHGFSSIVQAARKDFGLTDAESVRERLHLADEELLLRATKFVRAIGRDLKPLVDSYEMTTGQPVGEIYCAYLPPALAWIAEPLAQVVGRTALVMDCPAWMQTVKLQTGEGLPTFGQHWVGALSLVADLPDSRPDTAPTEGAPREGSWHIDCRLSAQLPSNDLVRRRFIANTIAATLAAATVMLAFWQLYSSRTLLNEVAYWEQRINENRRPVAEYNLATKNLTSLSNRFEYAHELMAAPYRVSSLIFSLGRTRPANMRVDSIDGSENGVVLRGGLREPSEQASRTLRRYVEDLRKDPAIGPLFLSIALTAIDRRDPAEGRGENAGPDTLSFAITFKLKAEQP